MFDSSLLRFNLKCFDTMTATFLNKIELLMLLKKLFFSSKSSKMSKKISYPSAENNKHPILEVLQKHLAKHEGGQVLEIASGTGQHISYFAPHFPNLTFQPSEYDTSLFDSIREYARDTPTKNVKDPIRIDVLQDWSTWSVPKEIDYVININMIHITSISCTVGLFKNVGAILKNKGLMITYGPYANNGKLEPRSNRDFDQCLRKSNPDHGIRDIQDLMRIAAPNELIIIKVYDLPANNKCLVWQKCKKMMNE